MDVAFDEQHLRLYVSIHQNFKLWVVPFYNAPVKLVTVLQLTTARSSIDIADRAASGPTLTAEIDTGKSAQGKKPDEAEDNKKTNGEKSSDGPGATRYWIQSQNDLYQTTEWIKFLIPWGVGVFLMILWQFYATLLCVAGAKIFEALVWIPKSVYRLHIELFDNDSKKHPHLGAD